MPVPQDKQVIAMSELQLVRHLKLASEAPSLVFCGQACMPLISLAMYLRASYVAYCKCTIDLDFPSLCCGVPA